MNKLRGPDYMYSLIHKQALPDLKVSQLRVLIFQMAKEHDAISRIHL